MRWKRNFVLHWKTPSPLVFSFLFFFHLINEKQAGCLSYLGFRTTQCLGIFISRYQDPIIGRPVECNNVFVSLLQWETLQATSRSQYIGVSKVSPCPKPTMSLVTLGNMNHHLSRSPSCAMTKVPNPLTTVYTINVPCRPHRNIRWWNMF